jgi:hypothetical protein
MRRDGNPEPGARGRAGVLLRYDRVERGGGRSHPYPVVGLDATARAAARTVRVLMVEPEDGSGVVMSWPDR